MADAMMRDLAPLLAEDGVDINDVKDIGALNRAMQKATERRNMELFTPVGPRRVKATELLLLIVEAIAEDKTELAGELLGGAQPESPDNSAAEVSSCIGLALGLLDDWLSGQSPDAPQRLADSFACRKATGSVSGRRSTFSRWHERAARLARSTA